MTAAMLKIPEVTVKVWRTTAWWKELENELKVQDELQLSTRLKQIAEKSFAVVEDRLEHGNYVYDQKTGKLKRVPVNLKDAHKVAVDSSTQRTLIGKKQPEMINDGQIAEKLMQLANKFAEIANQQYDKNRTFDVETVEVEEVSQSDENDNGDESSPPNN